LLNKRKYAAMAAHFPGLLPLLPPVQARPKESRGHFGCKKAPSITADSLAHFTQAQASVAVFGYKVHRVVVLHKSEESVSLYKPVYQSQKSLCLL
jgi:hypothetical protein